MTTYVKSVDYATPVDARQLAAAGVRVALRYGGIGGSWKWLTEKERNQLFAAGIAIFPLAEAAADRALSGRAAGQQDAHAARAWWTAMGLPATMPLAFAVDFNATTEQLAGAVTQYFLGIGDVEHGDYDYGGIGTVDFLSAHRLVGGGFQTYAWSGGKWSSYATIRQEQNDVPLAGGRVDLGEIASTVPTWYVKPAGVPAATNPTSGPLTATLRDGHSAAEDLVLTQVRADYLANHVAPAVLSELKAMEAAIANLTAIVTPKPDSSS